MTKKPIYKRTGSGTLRKVVWHPTAKEIVSFFPEQVRREMGYLLYLLQIGEMLRMPKNRPMPQVEPGVYELRVLAEDGTFRVFYYLKHVNGVLVFHAFQKKTQKTELKEIRTGKKRLGELLGVLDGKEED